jgi:hypothetical protein
MGGAGVEPALPPYQRGALPPELSAEWARLGSNQQPLVCKTSALPLELLARVCQIRDKESNLDLHVQSVVSCRLDDPGTTERSRAPPSISIPGDRRSRRAPSFRPSCLAGRTPSDVFHATRLPFDPGSPAAGCGRRPTWRSFGARASHVLLENRRVKRTLTASVYFQRETLRAFLSQAGPRFDLELVQAEHHLCSDVG